MAATSIRIDRLRESDIRRVVPRDHALRVLDVNRRLEAKRLLGRILEPAVIRGFAIPFLEAALDVDGRAAALDDFAVRARGGFQRHGRKFTRRNRDRNTFSKRNWQCG